MVKTRFLLKKLRITLGLESLVACFTENLICLFLLFFTHLRKRKWLGVRSWWFLKNFVKLYTKKALTALGDIIGEVIVVAFDPSKPIT